MARKSVLGKGIGALLSNSMASPKNFDVEEKTTKKKEVKPVAKKVAKAEKPIKKEVSFDASPMLVDINQLVANENQPRRFFKEDLLEELSESIKANGIIQPIIVTYVDDNKKFEIIAGERRFRAAKMAGLTKVPVISKKVTEKEKLSFAIIENVQRSDLNCVEEALAYMQLMNEFNLTQQEVATRIGKNRSTIANFLRLLKLPQSTIMSLQKEELSFGHAKVLSGLSDETKIEALTKKAVEGSWSVKELSEIIKNGEEPVGKGSTADSKNGNNKNGEFSILAEKLERTTGYQFNIKANPKNKGKIEIKFSDINEFNRIYKFLLKNN